jgi:hypothetical protein
MDRQGHPTESIAELKEGMERLERLGLAQIDD